MSEPPATLAFLPWLRRGVSTEITRKVFDTSVPLQTHAEFSTSLKFENINDPAITTFKLYGPGDIVGIDPSIIIRTYPTPNAANVESNYFPLIEFDQPDFPWRYTPARADGNERLLPWLVLIVLADGELSGKPRPAGRDGRLPSILVKSEFLPDLNQCWAWAHIQVSGHTESEIVANIVDNEPHRDLSRLLCARHLKPNKAYTAYLVPSFERGRLAGLKEEIVSKSRGPVDALVPAWPKLNNDRPIELPFYYQWRFQTGEAGDFESLVRQLLPPKSLPPSVGIQKMDVSTPGAGLPSASNDPLYLQGALISPAARGEVENEQWKEPEKTAFIDKLQQVVNNQYAELEIEDGQEGDSPGGAVTRLTLAAPLYGRWHAAREKLIPPGSEQHSSLLVFRNFLHSLRNSLGLSLPSTESSKEPLWFNQLNTDPRWRTVAGLGTQVVQVQQQQLMAGAWEQVEGILEVNRRLRQTQITRVIADRIYERHIKTQNEAVLLQIAAPLLNKIRSNPLTSTPLVGVGQETLKQALTRRAPGAKGVMAGQLRRITRPHGPIRRRQTRLLRRESSGTTNSQGVSPNLTSIYRFVIQDDNNNPDPLLKRRLIKEEIFRQADVQQLRGTVVTKIEPTRLIVAALNRRIEKRDGRDFQVDPLCNPIMAAPKFDQPMYKPLSDLSQAWLLPGVAEIPANTVSLLETNNRFVESYMVGLCHEMARELLWHEYPTDQRGTYFRQFWDVRGHIKPSGEVPKPGAEELKDIKPIPEWENGLGENSTRLQSDKLVLLIRGELLRRYPNAIIYAKELKNLQVFEGDERHPIFHGSLPPDISFLGFDLKTDEVRDNSDWYFVIQEQPTETRFGLDVAKNYGPVCKDWTWRDLSWGQLVSTEDELNNLIYINLEESKNRLDTSRLIPEPPDSQLKAVWTVEDASTAKSTASDFAYIFFQQPFRVAIHGSKMLPLKESE